jgi:UDP-glucose 4-epimerase
MPFYYFNPIGAHPSIEIELPVGVPQNLVPFIANSRDFERTFSLWK